MALGDFAKLIKGITLIAGAATGSYWLGTTLFPGATRSGFESTRYEAVPVSASAQVAAGTVETAPRMNTAAATAAPVPTPAHAAAPAATPAPDPAPAEAGALPAADFTVHTQKPARPISDLIYGANFHAENAETHTTELAYPIVRWGGNHTSRYNWRANIANRGADWFFINIPSGKYQRSGKPVSIADHVILANKSAGRDVLFTLPMLGWIPKDGEKRWAFSVKKYGAQQKTEPYDTDAGNGLKPSGETLTGNDPEDTSMRISPDWHVAWLAHMREILGGKTAANGGMRFFALDNEPDLWSSTHRDLRQGDAQLKTVAVGRDELWGRTVAYATALKKADPALQITGPVVGTWCGYFGSGEDIYDADGDCKTGGDRTSHEGLPFLQWYLRQICAHEKKTGLRLVDYLDVHYYPEDLDLRAETAPVARDRLERVRALYDAGFQDPSWIRDAVQLIPRLRGWIAAECPGTKLAVTEYRFGYENDSLSSTLAQAEALLVFGRDGVDLATTWGEIKSGGLYEGAFRLFLDYDGQGANARSGQSLRVEEPKGVKPERDPVLSYAIGVEKRVLVYLLNKSPLPRTKRLALDAGLSNARQFVLDTTGLAKTKIEAPSLDGRVTSLSVSLPPASMTLVELTP